MTDALAPDETLDPEIARLLKRDPAGLVAAVIQDELTREVLMVGWMDDLAIHRTLTSGRTTFFSRSRGQHWTKGETSGHRQWVRDVRLDCDGDTLLVRVIQEGAAWRVKAQQVQVGRRHGKDVEILAGLRSGERVVARGAGFLDDGDSVRVVEGSEESHSGGSGSP